MLPSNLQQFESGWLQPPTLKPNAGLKLNLEALLDRAVGIATLAILKDRNRDRIISEAIQL